MIVDKDLTLANYSDGNTTFNVKSGSTLTLKSYVDGEFIVEEGAMLVVEDFSGYARPLEITGGGTLIFKGNDYREKIVFPNGLVIIEGPIVNDLI